MPPPNTTDRSTEFACRTILTFHLLTVLAGYIVFVQTKYQLDSPIIPRSTIEMITSPYWKISLVESATFILSLWFYFLRLRIWVLVISSVSFVAYVITVRYFLYLIN